MFTGSSAGACPRAGRSPDLGADDDTGFQWLGLNPPKSFQIEPERVRLVRHLAATDRVDCRAHAAVAAEHTVGERHDAKIGRSRRRGATKLPRDRHLVATGVERAGRDKGARGRAADAGKAM